MEDLVLTAERSGARFSSDERDVLRSLASEATLALENIRLHNQVRQQEVTDLLTGLTNHGRFQELLSLEVEERRRYGYPVSLIMLDIDNFKSFNDAHGHPQGDVVLKQVAQVRAPPGHRQRRRFGDVRVGQGHADRGR